jgi:beta-galactosidase
MLKHCIVFILVFSCYSATAQHVSRKSFNEDWKFYLGDNKGDPSTLNFPDQHWRSLRLPHDWSIELPFDKDSPTGTGGGALRGGSGWYRKIFSLATTMRGKKVFIDFDGVYMNGEVFINGRSMSTRPNGYISFRHDLTPYLKYGTEKNVIVVKVDNSKQPNSRWYSGSGIYRNVWLTITDRVRVHQWGVHVTTPVVNKEKATLRFAIKIVRGPRSSQQLTIQTVLYDKTGKRAGRALTVQTTSADTVHLTQEMTIEKPELWSVDNPAMYRAVTKVLEGEKVLDEYNTPVGIRYFHFDPDKGFFLNDKHVKIRGVCMHHDLGCLGTAVNTRALQRQLEILKAMGCNGIRTSHNPPAPELLDLCDKMGFIVMDEAFDMWAKSKTPYDYHLYWEKWHRLDLEDQILRDRNHPSVFMWSLGNEIGEQWGKDTSGRMILRELVDITKRLDKTRPTVTANNEINTWNNLLQAKADDMIGYNYNHTKWDSVHYRWGKKPFIVTESVSSLQSRGHYDMPSDSIRQWPPRWDLPVEKANPDTTCSAYDNCHAPWGSTHEASLRMLEKYPHVSGMYIWTGFDYIGEPTPYPWPARSSYFGIVDLAGFPKDVYYLYQSVWTDKPVLHIFPHWNWTKGQTIDIWAYYNNADEVELFVNGRSAGVKKKQGDDLHVMWRTIFEPGTIKAVSRKNGKTILTKEIKTAGSPARLELLADRKIINADGYDLSFVTVKVVDKDGNLVPDASHSISFTTNGEGIVAATDNGHQTDLTSFQSATRKAFKGMCLAVIRSKGKTGDIKLMATADGLPTANLTITAK